MNAAEHRISVDWIDKGREYVARRWAALTADWADAPELGPDHDSD